MSSLRVTTVLLPPAKGRSIDGDSRRPTSRGIPREVGRRIKTGENSRPTIGENSTAAHRTEVLLAWDPLDPIPDALSGRIANVLIFWGSMATVPVEAGASSIASRDDVARGPVARIAVSTFGTASFTSIGCSCDTTGSGCNLSARSWMSLLP